MKLKLLLLLPCIVLYSKSFSQWNPNPAINVPVATPVNDQEDVDIITDTKSGAITTWVDYRSNTVASDIYAQRLNAAGVPVWTANGVAICTAPNKQTGVTAEKSGDGGAIIIWQDWRNGNQDIYAQKIDSTGTIVWTADGAPVCVKVNNQNNPRAISDDAGGVIIVWQDSSGTSNDIYAQRISNTGAAMWAPGGVVICNAGDSQINPKLKTDGMGGAIVIWQDKRSGDSDIYAQRINGSGAVQWAANGVAVCNAIGNQNNQKIETDGQNGAYIAWQDKRDGLGNDIYAQRINSVGAPQWIANGIAVCNAQLAQSGIDMTSNMVNGVIISWKDNRSGSYKIYTQLVTPAGAAQWTANGIEIAPGSNPNIVGDALGGAIITWQDSTTSGGTWNVYSQRLNANGTKLWATPSAPVAIANGGQSSPKNIADGNGGSIYAWQDKRNTLDADIYAHRITANGIVLSLNNLKQNGSGIRCYPNPFNAQTTITINNLNTSTTLALNVYDIRGRKVISKTIGNSGVVNFERNNLHSGVYFYQVSDKNRVVGSGNFTIVD